MADFIRRLVSGPKARFKDGNLDLELDLVYLTDNLIIMGYPASGVEGLYRNRREDAKKFLDHRHGKNYWVFNLCPVRENSYDASVFEGRVSRYPFPDHHAPPLAIVPLVVREMRAWLKGSPERVAVVHCKAGKGRSGSIACAYLLSLGDHLATAPKLQRSYNAKEWAQIRAEDAMAVVPDDVDDPTSPHKLTEEPEGEKMVDHAAQTHSPQSLTPASTLDTVTSPTSAKTINGGSKPKPHVLNHILDLHTSRRMKRPSSPSKKQKAGVSIPSQRRYLYYWALLLDHAAPGYFWRLPSVPSSPSMLKQDPAQKLKARLTGVKIRMKEASFATSSLVKAASMLLGHRNAADEAEGKGNGYKGAPRVWVSLARYNDDFVEMLEKWEKWTRDVEGGDMGVRRRDSESMPLDGEGDGQAEVRDIFKDDKWDKGKIVRSFARMGVDGGGKVDIEGEKDNKVYTYNLCPLTSSSWDTLKGSLSEETSAQKAEEQTILDKEMLPKSETASILEDLPVSPAASAASVVPKAKDPPGTKMGSTLTPPKSGQASKRSIIVDAEREIRMKLYMDQIFMGWLWFIPAFHLPPPPGTQDSSQPLSSKLLLTRKEVDFPIGAGNGVIDVEISMEWVTKLDTAKEKVKSLDPEENKGLVAEAAAIATSAAGKAGGADTDTAVSALQGDKD